MGKRNTIKMRDVRFNKELFSNYHTGTVMDKLLCSYQGLPKGVNYMIIGDPGVGKTTVILDMLANFQQKHPAARILFISAEMNEIDLAIYVQRFPKFGELEILFVENNPDEESHNWQTMTETLNEVKMANKLLTSLGVEEVEAEEIVPYAQLIDRYTAAGYDMKHTPLAQCRSHINMWELLNRITYFASHNPIWSTEDNRRSALMTESSKLLIRPRDIKRYIDVG